MQILHNIVGFILFKNINNVLKTSHLLHKILGILQNNPATDINQYYK